MEKSTALLSNRSIVRLVYLAAAVVIVLFALSNIFVLRSAGDIATDVRRSVEMDLVRNEIDRQIEVLANDQSQISYWDNTVKALGKRVDTDFVDDEIADWVWDDFGIETTVVADADGTPLVTVIRTERMAPRAGADLLVANADMIEAARARYMAARMPKADGFIVPDHPVRSHRPIYVAAIRKAHDTIGVMVAQAIVPDDDAVLPDGNPRILLTFKPLDDKALAAMGGKLGLAGFRLVEATGTAARPGGWFAIPEATGAPRFAAVWTPASPAETIWQRALPWVTVMMTAVAVVLLLIVLRHGRMLRALEASERKNRRLALHDALTGLPNRLQFDRALNDIIDAGKQDRCAILCLDLDRFKIVNDTYGHQAGDIVITTVAKRIADGIGNSGMAARVGGDEFIVLLHDNLDRDHVLWLCDALIESVCEPVSFDGGTASVGASIGVAWWPDDARTAKTVIRNADEALYRAKEAGRGRAYCAGEIDFGTSAALDETVPRRNAG